MIIHQTIHCITPGCGLTASLEYEGADPYGVFEHDGTPPFPHEVNELLDQPTGSGEEQLVALTAKLADLQNAVDQLIIDNLLGGF